MRGKSKHPELCTGAASVESNLKAVLSFTAPPHPDLSHPDLSQLDLSHPDLSLPSTNVVLWEHGWRQ